MQVRDRQFHSAFTSATHPPDQTGEPPRQVERARQAQLFQGTDHRLAGDGRDRSRKHEFMSQVLLSRPVDAKHGKKHIV